MIKIAVFGAGRIGQVHARNAAAHGAVELRYVVDPAGTAAADLAALSGAAAADADTVFADDGIDGVVIASATNTHAGLVERAAAAGKAVLCEKPLSIDFATAVACVETIERSGIRCMVGFQRRYDASYRAVRERSATAGREWFSRSTRIRAGRAASMDYLKVPGGLFRDSSIHDFDMARYLTGGEFGSVYAVGACLGDPAIGAIGDIDTAMIVLVARAGPLVQINNCRYAPFGYDQRIEVLASQAFLQGDQRARDPGRYRRQRGLHVGAGHTPLHRPLCRGLRRRDRCLRPADRRRHAAARQPPRRPGGAAAGRGRRALAGRGRAGRALSPAPPTGLRHAARRCRLSATPNGRLAPCES